MLTKLKPQLRTIAHQKPVQRLKQLPIHQINQWLLPRNRYGKRLLCGALGFIAFLYTIAQADGGLTFFLLAGPLLPVLILAIAGGFICLILSVAYALNFRKGHPAPLMVMLLGLYLVLKPSAPLSAEQVFFEKYQPQYQEVVELVRQEKLTHNDQCQDSLFAVPGKYQYLTGTCVKVKTEMPEVAIAFTPLDLNKPVVYAESREAVKSVEACHQNGKIDKQMDKNWYLCQMTP